MPCIIELPIHPLLWCDKSSSEESELMYHRQINTLSQTGNSLVSLEDDHHRVNALDPPPNNSTVWVRINNTSTPGIVTATTNTPRSYMVSTPMGQLRRNNSHFLNRTVTSEDVSTVEQGSTTFQSRFPVMTCSRAGVQLKPLKRLTLQEE